MADLIDLTGVLVDEEAAAPRFFCHSCNSDIENVTPVSFVLLFKKKKLKKINKFFFENNFQEYTCPVCSNGFVEELPPPAADSSSSDVDMTEMETYSVKILIFFLLKTEINFFLLYFLFTGF